MTEDENLELELYKNGSAESVLKRFVFSKEEQKLVKDAIRTANMSNPRMLLIHRADDFLKEVAKTRKPIEPLEKPSSSAEAMMNIEMAKLKKVNSNKDEKKIPFFYIPKTKFGRIIYFGMIAVVIFVQLMIFNSAQEIQNKTTQSTLEREKQMNLGSY